MTAVANDKPGAIGIRPEVTVLSVLRHLNYKAWFALSEFIDNALQSAIANSDRLRALHGAAFQLCVDVQMESTAPGLIVITDNAAGICEADFPRAFRAAQAPRVRIDVASISQRMIRAGATRANAKNSTYT